MLLKIGLDGVRQYVYSGRRVVAEYDGYLAAQPTMGPPHLTGHHPQQPVRL